jgi:hypothetical protein
MFHPFLVDLPWRRLFSALTGGRFGAEPAESGSDQEEAAGHIATGAVRVDMRRPRDLVESFCVVESDWSTRIVPPNSWLMVIPQKMVGQKTYCIMKGNSRFLGGLKIFQPSWISGVIFKIWECFRRYSSKCCYYFNIKSLLYMGSYSNVFIDLYSYMYAAGIFPVGNPTKVRNPTKR